MWQRFTERARRMTFFAQEEAVRLDQKEVAAEHFLLAMVREGDSVAARILDRMGISLGRIRSEVERKMERGSGRTSADMQLAESGKRVVNYAYLEADRLTNNYIGTEHLLLGLIREGLAEPQEITGQVLSKLSVDQERARREVSALQDSNNAAANASANGGDKPLQEPLASASSAMSQASAILLETEMRKLSPEQSAALQTRGLPSEALPPTMRFLLKALARQTSPDARIVPDPDNTMRVLIAPAESGTSYTLSTNVTLIATMMVQDE